MKKRRGDQTLTGAMLVADFQSVLISATTSEAAEHAARSSEEALLSQLSYVSGGMYLQPHSLADQQERMSHDSLDAHVKKIQAAQINEQTLAMNTEIQAEASHNYPGRTVKVDVMPGNDDALHGLWYSPNTGERLTPYKSRSILGTIDTVILDRNILIVRPRYTAKFLMRGLEAYVVYVINPQTAQPAVNITLR